MASGQRYAPLSEGEAPQQRLQQQPQQQQQDQPLRQLQVPLDGREPGTDAECGAGEGIEELSVESEADAPEAQWQPFVKKVALAISCFLLATFLLEKFAEERVTEASKWVMAVIGIPGLFVMVFLADGIPQPCTYVPLIFMAVKGSVDKHVVFLVCAAASYLAALTGYGIGYRMRQCWGEEWDRKLSEKFPEKYPQVQDMMERRGAWGVAFAALLPIPLALATWTAGSFGINFCHFLVAGMCRMPKIAIFVILSRAPGS